MLRRAATPKGPIVDQNAPSSTPEQQPSPYRVLRIDAQRAYRGLHGREPQGTFVGSASSERSAQALIAADINERRRRQSAAEFTYRPAPTCDAAEVRARHHPGDVTGGATTVSFFGTFDFMLGYHGDEYGPPQPAGGVMHVEAGYDGEPPAPSQVTLARAEAPLSGLGAALRGCVTEILEHLARAGGRRVEPDRGDLLAAAARDISMGIDGDSVFDNYEDLRAYMETIPDQWQTWDRTDHAPVRWLYRTPGRDCYLVETTVLEHAAAAEHLTCTLKVGILEGYLMTRRGEEAIAEANIDDGPLWVHRREVPVRATTTELRDYLAFLRDDPEGILAVEQTAAAVREEAATVEAVIAEHSVLRERTVAPPAPVPVGMSIS